MIRTVPWRRCTLLVAWGLIASACDSSPSEPDPDQPTFAIERLSLSVSSVVAVGRTVAPHAGAYRKDSSSPIPSSELFFYPADSGLRPAFESSNAGVVRVNDDATLTAVAIGTAYIKVTLAGKRDSVLVSVIPGFDMQFIAGTDSVSISGVNDAGDVAGMVYQWPIRFGVLIKGGQRTDIGDCLPSAMNNAGQIACNFGHPGGASGNHPAVHFNGVVTYPFGSTADAPTGSATDITESGRLYGVLSVAPGSGSRVFLGGSDSLEFLPGSSSGQRIGGQTGGVNELSHGAGRTTDCLYCTGYIVSRAGIRALGALNGRYSAAHDINSSDDVIGSSEDMSVGGKVPTLWRTANAWKPERLPRRITALVAISDRGHVLAKGNDGAVIWRDAGVTILADAVSETGWTFGAAAISKAGVIAVRGEHPVRGRGVVIIRMP